MNRLLGVVLTTLLVLSFGSNAEAQATHYGVRCNLTVGSTLPCSTVMSNISECKLGRATAAGVWTDLGDLTRSGSNVTVTGLALDSTGNLFGFEHTTGGMGSQLVSIAPATAAVTTIGMPLGKWVGAAVFDNTGTLYVLGHDIAPSGAGYDAFLGVVNPATGALVGPWQPIIEEGAQIQNSCYSATLTIPKTGGLYMMQGADRLMRWVQLDGTARVYSPAQVAGTECSGGSTFSDDLPPGELLTLDHCGQDNFSRFNLASVTDSTDFGVPYTAGNAGPTDMAGYINASATTLTGRPLCGDGIENGTDQCEDGNLANNDGCNQFCELECGFVCQGALASDCEPGGYAVQCESGLADPADRNRCVIVRYGYDGTGTGQRVMSKRGINHHVDGVAMDSTGRMIGFAGDSTDQATGSHMVLVNPSSGILNRLGPDLNLWVTGAAFNTMDQLWVLVSSTDESNTTYTPQLAQIDPTTGMIITGPTNLTEGGSNVSAYAVHVQDIAFRPDDSMVVTYSTPPLLDNAVYAEVTYPGAVVTSKRTVPKTVAEVAPGGAMFMPGGRLFVADILNVDDFWSVLLSSPDADLDGSIFFADPFAPNSGSSDAAGCMPEPFCTSDADCPLMGDPTTDDVCDITTGTCTLCIDDMPAGSEDSGCSGATPICDDTGAAPVCVECLVDADCPGQCNTATNLCEDRTDPDNECMFWHAPTSVDDSNIPEGRADLQIEETFDRDTNPNSGYATPGAGIPLPATVSYFFSQPVDAEMFTLWNDAAVDTTNGIAQFDLIIKGAGGAVLHTVSDVMPSLGLTRTDVDLGMKYTGITGFDMVLEAADPAGSSPNEPQWTEVALFEAKSAGTSCAGGFCDGMAPSTCEMANCFDDETGATQDTGCTMATPICDTDDDPDTCVTCLDDMMPGSQDTGCAAAAPICDDATNPHMCVVCQVDRDCPTGVCDTSVPGGACVPCRDSVVVGMDAGCLGATPVCDTSASPNTCVECLATSDCSGGVCDTMTNTCVECTDDQSGAVPDGGCVTPTSYCDDSDPAAPTCVECTEDSQCSTGVCDTDANTCVVCVDSAVGAADTGCGGAAPVCDTSAPAGECVPCENDQMTGMDFGCDGAMPTCDEMAAGGPTCVACADTESAGGTDDGCDSDTPACDEMAAGGPECVVCLDDQAGGFNDSGCPSDSPVCDDMGATPGCHPCLDSTSAGGRDNGCPSATPTCDESTDPNECVECLSNDDCPGGACDTASQTCAACVDDEVGAEDSGCGDPRPVCDGDSGTCLPCEDTGDGTDFGCDSSSPICDESDPSNPECVECEDNDDCMSGVCDAMTSTCVGCINSEAMGTDSGCMGTENICDAPMGDSGMCVECINTTSGMTDDGCDVTSPVCDAAAGEAGTCTTCEDTSDSSAMQDNGCPLSAPICDTSVSGGSCVECEANADCTTGACDTESNTCVTCVDNTMGDTDAGCSSATPVCDVATDPGNPTCVACEDSEDSGLADNGCETPRTVCDEDAAAGPTCVSCVDDMSGAQDTGCTEASPVCFTGGAEPECVTCEDSDTDPDFGCPATATNICDDSTPSSPTCIECEGDDDCEGVTPVCNPSGTCVPGCNDDDDCPDGVPVCDTDAMACVECTESADCPGDTPVCDPAVNSCVECLMNDDCPAGDTPVCDMGEQVCVECVANGDCPMGVCDTLSDTCVGCVTNDDCPGATPVCDPTMAECVECLSNSECMDPAAPICSETTNTCVECVRGADCPSGMCELSTGTCSGPECQSNDDCVGLDPNLPVCDVGSCVECLATSDCESDEVCDVANRLCVPSCEEDDDCSEGVCLEDDGVCVECEETSDCSGDDVCNTASNTCGPGCEMDSDCESAPGLPVCETDDGVCVECLESDDCMSGVCDARNTCVECVEDADCPVGVCAAFGACVECDSDDDCDDDQFCDVAASVCSDDCESDEDCTNPALSVCDEDEGACEECLEHDDCADMEVCTDTNICQPGCTEDDDCESDAPLCQTSTGACVECGDDDDCEGDETCSDDFECVEPMGMTCEDDEDCEGATAICDTEGGVCVACLEDDDCEDDGVCTPELSCALGCEDNDECEDDEVCSEDGFCTPGGNVSCTDDDECEDALAGTVCLDSGICGCTEDDECLDSLECNTDAEYCGCGSNDDCESDEVCDLETRTCEGDTSGGGGLSGGSCSVNASESSSGAAPFVLFGALGLLLFRRKRD